MTEAKWLACTDPEPMLDFLRGKLSERKLRLFACACCRQVRPFSQEENYRRALETAERHADGQATEAELRAVFYSTGRSGSEKGLAAVWFAEAIACLCSRFRDPFLLAQGHAARSRRELMRASDWSLALREQAQILRDIAGHLFHPVVATPVWVLERGGGTVGSIARAIYEESAFSDLPVLADALEEAGCTDAAILSHCRAPGPHVRGCWVVDLLTARA
jgi:hypothetical protein